MHSHSFIFRLSAVLQLAVICLIALAGVALAHPTYGVLIVGNDTNTSGLACSGTDSAQAVEPLMLK